MWWLENNGILSPTQFGFRKRKGCQDCVALLVSEIKLAFQRKEMMVAVFLDIKAAYNNVDVKGLIQKLNENGKQLCHRSLCQGLPLPPTLFNVDINDIGDQMKLPVQSLEYADDCVIYFPCKKIEFAQAVIQETLQSLEDWVFNKGFGFSAEKS